MAIDGKPKIIKRHSQFYLKEKTFRIYTRNKKNLKKTKWRSGGDLNKKIAKIQQKKSLAVP